MIISSNYFADLVVAMLDIYNTAISYFRNCLPYPLSCEVRRSAIRQLLLAFGAHVVTFYMTLHMATTIAFPERREDV